MFEQFSHLKDQVWNQVFNQQNQFLQGGLVLGMIGGVIAYFRNLPLKIWKWFLYYCTIELDITNQDSNAYAKILYWLNQQNYSKKTRRLSLKYMETPERYMISFVPARGQHIFFWKRRLIWMNRYEEDKPAGNGNFSLNKETISLRMVGRKQKVLQDLINEALSYFKNKKEWKFTIYSRGHGNWDGYEYENPRKLSTVVLPDQARDLVADVQAFLDRRDWYNARGIPYRRGYLFHGPPGTGKSSTAAALAAHLKMDLYVLNLGTIAADDSLINQLSEVGGGTKPVVLLIEDIDTAIPDSRNFDKEKHKFSLGTLLNGLDGVMSNDNIILIMTTNKIDSLDPALLRPGRVDRKIEFHNANYRQIEEAVRLFFPDRFEEIHKIALGWEHPISMATVQERLRNMALMEKEKEPIPPAHDVPDPEIEDNNNVVSSPISRIGRAA